jgi:hypothetical protein
VNEGICLFSHGTVKDVNDFIKPQRFLGCLFCIPYQIQQKTFINTLERIYDDLRIDT